MRYRNPMTNNIKTGITILSLSFLSCSLAGCLQGGSGSGKATTENSSYGEPPGQLPEEAEGTTPSGSDFPSVRFNAFADMNVNTDGTYSSHTQAIVQRMTSSNPAVILGLGDYIDGESKTLSESTYIKMWQAFKKKVVTPIESARIPFLPSPGNHDAYYSHERELYREFWNTYKASIDYVNDRNFPFYYSFMKDGVFFVSLDDANYSKLSDRTAQLNWLKEQLSSARAQSARARVVYGHIPLYSIVSTSANSSTVYENGVLKSERRTNGSFTLEAILLSHRVDLVLFAHSHGFYPGHYVYPDGKKLRVVSLPCAGGSQRYLIGTSTKTPHGYVDIQINEDNKISVRYVNSSGVEQNFSSLPKTLTLDSKSNVKYERM